MVVLRGKGIGHMIWRMCSGCKRIVIGILWELPDSCRIFKLGREIDHVTRHVCPLTKVKRLKVKVTRSRNISAGITLKVVVQCWPQRTHSYFLGLLPCCHFGQKSIKKCNRERLRVQTERQTRAVKKTNWFYNFSHGICYTYRAYNCLYHFSQWPVITEKARETYSTLCPRKNGPLSMLKNFQN